MVPLRILRILYIKYYNGMSWVEVRAGGVWIELSIWLDGLPAPSQVYHNLNHKIAW